METRIKTRSLNLAIRQQIVDVLREIMIDDDRGLALKGSFVKKLRNSIKSKHAGRVKSLNEVLAKY